ncbi:MAG TPA: hypothetical protein VH640_23340 [Bryobacteraceae bacterium]|jgi:DNA-directed RNA polymerase specialized sigma24 family protein
MPSRSHSRPRRIPHEQNPGGSAPQASFIDEKNELMELALRTLSPRDREVLDRFYVREEPAEEICAL